MTLEQTRQLGIEFERRVQTMIPEKEYLDKLDTDTIYAYLNSYQDKYIHDIYRNLDQIKSGSKLSAHVESVLQLMLRTLSISVELAKNNTLNITDPNGIVIIENGRSVTYPLDPSFYMYVRSVSSISSTYSFKNNDSTTQPIRVLPNELVSQSDVWRLLETPHNSLRILRYPAATIGAYEKFNNVKTYTVSSIEQIKQSQSCSFDPTDFGLSDPGHYSANNLVFKFNTYDSSVENQEDYRLYYEGENTTFRYCIVLYTPYGGADDWTASSSIVGNATLEQVKNALFVSDTTQVPYVLVWIDGVNAGNNKLNLKSISNTDMNGEYTEDLLLQLMPETNLFDSISELANGESFVFQYNSLNYTITLSIKNNVNLPTLNVIYDRYTTPVGVKVVYYAQPLRFSPMTSKVCELPMDAFDDLVTGAVDLYVQYVAGAEANKHRIQEALRQQAKQNKKDNEDED